MFPSFARMNVDRYLGVWVALQEKKFIAEFLEWVANALPPPLPTLLPSSPPGSRLTSFLNNVY